MVCRKILVLKSEVTETLDPLKSRALTKGLKLIKWASSLITGEHSGWQYKASCN
jgi:hypothetical protein